MTRLELDIQKSYKDFSLQISLSAELETLGIMGASGCGKSQTLRAIAGIMTPDAGYIKLGNELLFDKIDTKRARVNLKPQQRRVAYLFQNYQLFPNMSVKQNIQAGMKKTRSEANRQEELEKQLSFFHLESLQDKLPSQLSGGQQQRVALARMLASSPRIMMLDEPFSALDANLKSELYPELIAALRAFQGPRLYVSHDIDEAFMFCDRMLVIDRGHIADQGSAERVVTQPRSLASMKLAGFANISRAVKIAPSRIYAQDWDMELECENPVEESVSYVGIRDNALEVAAQTEPFAVNSKHWQGIETKEQPNCNIFYGKVLFNNSGVYRRQTTLTVGKQSQVQMVYSRSLHSREELLHSGDEVKVYLDPYRLCLVNH